jgi:hypothetical protein
MFDTDYKLEDGAAAKTASGYGEVDSSSKVANLGSGLIRGNVIVDVFQMALTDNDELYQIHLMGGGDTSFTKEVSLATLELGVRERIEGNQDSKSGRHILPFENEKNGVTFPYVRVRHVIGGTSPSIKYEARLEKDLPVRGFISSTVTTTTT